MDRLNNHKIERTSAHTKQQQKKHLTNVKTNTRTTYRHTQNKQKWSRDRRTCRREGQTNVFHKVIIGVKTNRYINLQGRQGRNNIARERENEQRQMTTKRKREREKQRKRERERERERERRNASNTYTHIHTYIYMYILINYTYI